VWADRRNRYRRKAYRRIQTNGEEAAFDTFTGILHAGPVISS
jgi:hypothetical protein